MAMAMASLGVNLSSASVCSNSSSSLASLDLKFRSAPSLRAPLLQSIEAKILTRRETVKLRHTRIRKKLGGTEDRPRLAVFRSNQHLYAQVIDDTKGFTLASASTIQKDLREELGLSAGPTVDAAKKIGTEIAKACLAKGITKVAFDRGGFVYHGRIKALADAARENGLNF